MLPIQVLGTILMAQTDGQLDNSIFFLVFWGNFKCQIVIYTKENK